MDYYKFESFDITSLIEQYHGKKLEDLFQNYRIIKNDMGEFIEIIWEEEISPKLDLFKTKRNMLCNLKIVNFIGECIESKLKRRGIKNLKDLKYILTFSNSAYKILSSIENKDYKALKSNRYISDLDVSFCFEIEDFLFLDIETLGIIDSPIIIVGIGFYENEKFRIQIFFARELEEEIAICEHLRSQILPNFKCFISFNGKTFDLPFLANRFLYFFDKNPMISDDDEPYEKVNTQLHHIDLYHHCRRLYKGLYDNYSLTNIEEKLLKWQRENTLPSNLVGICYRKFKENPKRYIGLMKEVIEHNYYDVKSLNNIFSVLLKE